MFKQAQAYSLEANTGIDGFARSSTIPLTNVEVPNRRKIISLRKGKKTQLRDDAQGLWAKEVNKQVKKSSTFTSEKREEEPHLELDHRYPYKETWENREVY